MATAQRSSDYSWVTTAGLFFLLAAVIFGAGQWLGSLSVGSAHSSADATPALPSSPHTTINGFRFLQSPAIPSSWPVWELRADRADVDERLREVDVTNLVVTFSPARGTTSAVLTGRRGRFDLESMNFTIDGVNEPLTIHWRDRYQVRTDHLTWKNAEQVMVTDAEVSIEGEGLRATGTGLRWSPSEGVVTILSRVSTTVTSQP
jgi:LPS export ABC transporter protein LptC